MRICFLAPSTASAHGVVDELRARGIKDTNIFVVAHEGTDLGDLPDAGAVTSDFYPQLERGLAAGAAVGVIGGLVAMRVAGAVLGGAALLLFGLLGATVNGLLSAIAGSAYPDSRLGRFQQAIEAGQVLIMVDVARADAAATEEAVRQRHPEATFEGLEPHVPVVPRA
jgi:hypothetical protein